MRRNLSQRLSWYGFVWAANPTLHIFLVSWLAFHTPGLRSYPEYTAGCDYHLCKFQKDLKRGVHSTQVRRAEYLNSQKGTRQRSRRSIDSSQYAEHDIQNKHPKLSASISQKEDIIRKFYRAVGWRDENLLSTIQRLVTYSWTSVRF
jgi:hypothetical protein